jgi:uncharacterized membrane protein YdjX (TVP38/TMEM64 family)
MRKGLLVAAALAMVISGALLLMLLYDLLPLDRYRELFEFYANQKAIARYVKDFGTYAPIAFIALQALQVVAAPVPGEATGILGGYLFGTLSGLIYSTIGLTIGSALGFGLGRWLGLPFVRRFVKHETYHKFDFLTRTKGELVVFLLFLIPGFPKDILCYLLGVSPIPFLTFLLLSTLGRIPGTWLLSVQGTKVRGHDYFSLFLLLSVLAVGLLLAYLHRDRIVEWIKHLHHRKAVNGTTVVKDPEDR